MRTQALGLLSLLCTSCSAPSTPTGSPPELEVGRQPLWATLPTLAEDRLLPNAARLSGTTALVAGGEAGDHTTSSAEIFDLGTRTFKPIPPMKAPRHAALVAPLPDGRVLVAGGHPITSSAEIFDPKTNTWSAAAPMRTARARAVAVPLADGSVLVAGGEDGIDETNAAEVYSPAADAWASVGPLNTTRRRHAAVRLKDGRVFVAGGFNRTVYGELARAEVYDPATRTFREVGEPIPQAFGSAVALLGDGRVFLTGGDPDALAAEAKDTWLFDPKTNGLSKGPALPEERSDHSMTTLPSGKVLFVGGDRDGSTRLFDPAAGTFGKQEFLLTRRYLHASILLDTAVLVAGGSVDLGGYAGDSDLAELWTDAAELTPSTSPPTTPPPTNVTGVFARCAADAECPTGHCVDGVCCDTACRERCHSCALPSSPGVCSEEPVGVDLRAECGAALSCSGTCGPKGECIGSTKGSLCAPSRCIGASRGVGPVTCATSGGACPVASAVPFDCAPYTCEPAFGACSRACSSSAECSGGFVCDVTSKTCLAPVADGGDDGGCALGPPSRGAAPLGLLVLLAGMTRRRRSR